MIPKSFKIAGLNFTVEEVDNLDDGGQFGLFDCNKCIIYLANQIKLDTQWEDVSDQVKENSFYHELFHVFHYLMDNEIPETEAQVYANFLCEFNQTKV